MCDDDIHGVMTVTAVMTTVMIETMMMSTYHVAFILLGSRF